MKDETLRSIDIIRENIIKGDNITEIDNFLKTRESGMFIIFDEETNKTKIELTNIFSHYDEDSIYKSNFSLNTLNLISSLENIKTDIYIIYDSTYFYIRTNNNNIIISKYLGLGLIRSLEELDGREITYENNNLKKINFDFISHVRSYFLSSCMKKIVGEV